MYAAIMHLSFDADLAPAAASVFSNELLPRVRRAAGFVHGCWLDPVDGRGVGMLIFQDEGQTRRASAADQWLAPGVTVESVDIRQVAAMVP